MYGAEFTPERGGMSLRDCQLENAYRAGYALAGRIAAGSGEGDALDMARATYAHDADMLDAFDGGVESYFEDESVNG